MGLKGDLSTTGLFEIFQMISMSQKEGTLVVEDATSRKSIHFSAKGVQVLSTGERRGLRLGDILIRHGLITEGQLAEVLRSVRASGKRLGEALVENGYVDEGLIQQVVREQIEEEIYDLFLWKKAHFEFNDGPADKGLADPGVTQLTFDVNGLLLEAIRRADQWDLINKKIPSLECVFTFTSDGTRAEGVESAGGDWLRRAYRLLDGQRSVAEILDDTGLPKFELCKGLVDLLDRGRIRPLDVAELMKRADRILSTDGRERGLRLYRAAAAQAAEDTKVLGGMASVLESHGLAQEAATCLIRAARILMTRSNYVRALECMERAAAIRPEDAEPVLGILEVLIADKRLDKAKAFVRDRAPLALREADPLRARALCDRVVAADPDDLEFRVLRARAYHQANQPKALHDELRYIHEHLPADPEAAEKVKRTLPETRTRLQLQAEAPARRRTPWKRILGIAALLLAALAGAGGWLAKRETDAMAELDRLIAEARLERNWAEARRRVQAFLQGPHRHAFTPREKAAAFLDGIEGLERAATEDVASRERLRRQEEEKRFLAELEEIREEFPRAPDRALERARAIARATDDRGARGRELTAELERLLEEARQLRESADTLTRDGQTARACEAIDRLLARFPNTEAARDVRYPLAISSRPAGVKVTNARTGEPVGVTSDGPLLMLLSPTEAPPRLVFEKAGYASPPPRDVLRKNAGALRVELTEKLHDWAWTAGRPIAGDPAALGNLVFVAASNHLTAVKAGSKAEPVWSETLEGAAMGSPLVANGLVYVATEKWLYAIDPEKSGAERTALRYELGERASGPPGMSTDGALVHVGVSDRTLRAVDARTLKAVWTLTLPGEARGEPVSAGPLLLVACDNGALLAFDAATRRETWKARSQAPFGPLLVAGATLYVTSPDPFLYAVDAASGRPVWPRRALPAKSAGRPLHADGLIFTGGMDGLLHRTDARSGKSAGSFPSGAAIRGGAAMAGPLLLFGNDDGVLHALDAGTYESRWTLRCPGPLRGTPVVAGGRAYLSCGDTLIAVTLD